MYNQHTHTHSLPPPLSPPLSLSIPSHPLGAEANPEEFFLPYVWSLVVAHAGIPWHLEAIVLFTPSRELCLWGCGLFVHCAHSRVVCAWWWCWWWCGGGGHVGPQRLQCTPRSCLASCPAHIARACCFGPQAKPVRRRSPAARSAARRQPDRAGDWPALPTHHRSAGLRQPGAGLARTGNAPYWHALHTQRGVSGGTWGRWGGRYIQAEQQSAKLGAAAPLRSGRRAALEAAHSPR